MTKRKRDNRLADNVSLIHAYGCFFIRFHGKDGSVFAHARLRRDGFVELLDDADALLEDAPDLPIGAPLH